jgi:hypothetical protein
MFFPFPSTIPSTVEGGAPGRTVDDVNNRKFTSAAST